MSMCTTSSHSIQLHTSILKTMAHSRLHCIAKTISNFFPLAELKCLWFHMNCLLKIDHIYLLNILRCSLCFPPLLIHFPLICCFICRSWPISMHIVPITLHAWRRSLHGMPRLTVLRSTDPTMQNMPWVVSLLQRPRPILMCRLRLSAAFGPIE